MRDIRVAHGLADARDSHPALGQPGAGMAAAPLRHVVAHRHPGAALEQALQLADAQVRERRQLNGKLGSCRSNNSQERSVGITTVSNQGRIFYTI
jgi:hypothetical protein